LGFLSLVCLAPLRFVAYEVRDVRESKLIKVYYDLGCVAYNR